MARNRLQFDFMLCPYILDKPDGKNTPSSTPDAIILNVGTTAEPVESSSSGNILNLRAEFTHSSGDARLIYNRLYLDGDGDGESLRSFTTVRNSAKNAARGAHISLNFADSGDISGLGTAITGTLHLPAGGIGGNVAAIEAQLWLDGATSDVPTEHGILRLNIGGDATNLANVKNLLHISGVKATAAATGVTDMVTTGTDDTVTDTAIRVRINGTNYWLLASSSAPSAP